MDFNFDKLENDPKNIISIFASLKLKNYGDNFLQVKKLKTHAFVFCKLKKAKKQIFIFAFCKL